MALMSYTDIVHKTVQLDRAEDKIVKYIIYINSHDVKLHSMVQFCRNEESGYNYNKKFFVMRDNEANCISINVYPEFFYKVYHVDCRLAIPQEIVKRATIYFGTEILTTIDNPDGLYNIDKVIAGADGNHSKMLIIDMECTKDVTGYHGKRIKVRGATKLIRGV